MTWSDLQSVATALGILSAGGFFIFKAVFGYNNVNCSISVTCERRHKNDSTDFVGVTVTLEKGPNNALSLLRGEVRVTPAVTAQPADLQVYRLKTTGSTACALAVVWDAPAPERALFVSPGEKMHFACFAEVPRDKPCRIEAVILGRKRLRRVKSWARAGFLGQWRATSVSLPISDGLRRHAEKLSGD